jgi:hypothetical protein
MIYEGDCGVIGGANNDCRRNRSTRRKPAQRHTQLPYTLFILDIFNIIKNVIPPLPIGLHVVVLNQLSTGATSPYLTLPLASSLCIIVLQRIALEIFYYFCMDF